MRLKNRLLPLLLPILLISGSMGLRAQSYTNYYNDIGVAIYLNNPIGWISKFRVKAEYRMDVQKSIMVSYASYYGFFPGYQAGLEYRNYHELLSQHEHFWYAKMGLGEAKYKQIDIWAAPEMHAAPGSYVFAGGGVGKHWNFDNFFIDINVGLKYTFVPSPEGDYNEIVFYSVGPGSIADINAHIGLQF
jgi:hypothetical protein